MKSKHSPIVHIHRGGEPHWVGDGFPVRSLFGYDDLGQEVSPFLLLDYAAPYTFSPGQERRGVGEHPHRGFETVTIAYQGEIEHRDSSGAGGVIGAGDVQWMTAARGLVHEELHSRSFTEKGGVFEMVQLWVNLPAKFKNAPPGYQTLHRNEIPREMLAEGRAQLRVIAGSLFGVRGPARTFTPVTIADISFKERAEITVPFEPNYTNMVVVLQGGITIDGGEVAPGSLALLDRSGAPTLELSARAGTKLLLLSGEPINEPIVGRGPFVMNTQAEIRQAFADFQRGEFGRLR